jgi:pimeloyl-ACP methyl ester carboxylesterase
VADDKRDANDMTKRILPTAIAMLAFTFQASAAPDCAALSDFAMSGRLIEISQAREIAAGPVPTPSGPPDPSVTVPAHCRVDGIIDPRVGHDGKRFAIGFAVALPREWNGRFLFQGGGGLNGSVGSPIGRQFAGERSALERGFAVASTDSGHQGAVFDASFFADQEAALNFLYQAVAEVTLVAKEVVARHYGRPSDRAYFVGCSTGGREAMMMSQRFPRYFDGIVSVAPAIRTSFSNLGLRHAASALNEIAPKDEAGIPQTNKALSDANRHLVIGGILKSCDSLDGNADGFVFVPHLCHFDPGTLECARGKKTACLTRPEVNAVRRVMAGPRTASGRQVYPGYYFDTGIANTRGLPGILAGPFIPEGPAVGSSMDVDAAAADAMSARAMVGDTGAWTNLGGFRTHGGKLIFAHGVSDPWFSARDTVDYYERLERDNPGSPLRDWSRLFLVPGMGHCGGGERTLDRFDALSAIVEWTEHSSAPDRMIATGASAPGESRPLCPYPEYARHDGKGDPGVAGSYVCERPR